MRYWGHDGMTNTMKFGKAAKNRLNLSAVPRETGAVDRLLDNSRQIVRLELIDDNPRNPRAERDDAELRELAESIAEHGLLQAPVVRRHPEDPDRYMVVMGARRVAAHRVLGRDEIEVIVRRFDDQQAFLVSCVENLQRVQLSPREEMDLIGVLSDELGSGDAVARALGKSKAWVSKRRRIVNSPAFAAAVERGEIAVEHAYDVLAGSASDEEAVARLERVRGGSETRAQTRGAKRGARATARGSAGVPGTDSPETSSVSRRNSHGRGPDSIQDPQANDALADTATIRAIDAASGIDAHAVDRLEDLIDPRTLTIAKLVRKGAKVSRATVLEALHTDLQAIE